MPAQEIPQNLPKHPESAAEFTKPLLRGPFFRNVLIYDPPHRRASQPKTAPDLQLCQHQPTQNSPSQRAPSQRTHVRSATVTSTQPPTPKGPPPRHKAAAAPPRSGWVGWGRSGVVVGAVTVVAGGVGWVGVGCRGWGRSVGTGCIRTGQPIHRKGFAGCV